MGHGGGAGGSTDEEEPEAAVAAQKFPRLDRTLWVPDERLMLGNRLARQLLAQTRSLAEQAAQQHRGQRPRLCVITVDGAGSTPTPLGRSHEDGKRRLDLLGVPDASWFDKRAAGVAVGIDVEELSVVPEEGSGGVTTAQLV